MKAFFTTMANGKQKIFVNKQGFSPVLLLEAIADNRLKIDSVKYSEYKGFYVFMVWVICDNPTAQRIVNFINDNL